MLYTVVNSALAQIFSYSSYLVWTLYYLQQKVKLGSSYPTPP